MAALRSLVVRSSSHAVGSIPILLFRLNRRHKMALWVFLSACLSERFPSFRRPISRDSPTARPLREEAVVILQSEF